MRVFIDTNVFLEFCLDDSLDTLGFSQALLPCSHMTKKFPLSSCALVFLAIFAAHFMHLI